MKCGTPATMSVGSIISTKFIGRWFHMTVSRHAMVEKRHDPATNTQARANDRTNIFYHFPPSLQVSTSKESNLPRLFQVWLHLTHSKIDLIPSRIFPKNDKQLRYPTAHQPARTMHATSILPSRQNHIELTKCGPVVAQPRPFRHHHGSPREIRGPFQVQRQGP